MFGSIATETRAELLRIDQVPTEDPIDRIVRLHREERGPFANVEWHVMQEMEAAVARRLSTKRQP